MLVVMGVELEPLRREEFGARLHAVAPPGLGPRIVDALYVHYCELRRWNRRLSLVGPGMAPRVVERLYGESLAALELLDPGCRALVDVGSGAGFPGLILAAARPELEVTLIEPRQKKCAFLRAAADRAALSCTCLGARVSAALPAGVPERIDAVTVRALTLEPSQWKALAARMGARGAFILWQAGEEPRLPPGFVRGRAVELPEPERGRVIEVLKR